MFDFNKITLPITKEDLLNNVSSEAIFTHYFGNFRLRRVYSSPLRKDKDPSFGFCHNKQGELICHDIVTNENLSAINFVARLLSITYKEAIIRIANDFNIHCLENISKTQNRNIERSIKNSDVVKKQTIIQVVTKEYTQKELDYWNRWQISKEELQKEQIFSIQKYYVNKERIPMKREELIFAIYQKDPETDKGYFKIYKPEATEYKWTSNIALSLPFGIDRLPHKSDTLIVSKSAKERVCLLKIFSDVIATQNESITAIEKVVDIAKDYKEVVVIFDADNAGVKACTEITNSHGWKYFNVPYYLYEEQKIKDIAEYIEAYGYKNLTKLLKEKKIIK